MHTHRHKRLNCNYIRNVKAPNYIVDIGGHNTKTSFEILFFLLLCIFLMTFRATFSNEYSGYNFCLVSRRLLVQILAETCNIIISLFFGSYFILSFLKEKSPGSLFHFSFSHLKLSESFNLWLKSFWQRAQNQWWAVSSICAHQLQPKDDVLSSATTTTRRSPGSVFFLTYCSI